MKRMPSLIPSASQTVGPFFNFGLTTNHALGIMAPDAAEGEHITLVFRIIDGEGLPTPGDSMIELWQADSQGRYQHPADPRSAAADKNFCGFGRLETDANGVCVFETVKPGSVPDPGVTLQAPHINVTLFGRGLGKPLRTRRMPMIRYWPWCPPNGGKRCSQTPWPDRRARGPSRSICKAKRKLFSSICNIGTCKISSCSRD
jgi:hypothetical protein